MMKIKRLCFLIVIIFLLFIPCVFAKEKESVTLYLFHGDGCPHCAEEIAFLDTLKDQYDNLKIVQYEVWYDSENAQFMQQVKDSFHVQQNGVPFTIIGSSTMVGYSDADSSRIRRAIEYYFDHDYVDYVQQIKDGTFSSDDMKKVLDDEFSQEEKKTDQESTIYLPFFGQVNLKSFSLSTAAILIGLVDGFNPCAMWVLLFLISVLITMKDRKRMWIFGSTFLLASGLVYLAIMLSWIQVVVHVSTSILIRNLIAGIAFFGGVLQLRSFVRSKSSGCEVVKDTKRRKIFARIKKFTSERSIFLALCGVILLAISVNVVELACSAGLPFIFTQLLALNQVSFIQEIYYTILYLIFFLLDDFIVFIVAMVSLKITGISTKYNRYSHLIGGIFMIGIGVLLFFHPEWLMGDFSK